MIYRGFDLNEIAPGKWTVHKNGVLINTMLGSEEAALSWCDRKRREENAKAETGR